MIVPLQVPIYCGFQNVLFISEFLPPALCKNSNIFPAHNFPCHDKTHHNFPE